MKKLLHQLMEKRFTVYEGGEYFGRTSFMGIMRLLFVWAEFGDYTEKEKIRFFRDALKDGYMTVDSNIFVKIS